MLLMTMRSSLLFEIYVRFNSAKNQISLQLLSFNYPQGMVWILMMPNRRKSTDD